VVEKQIPSLRFGMQPEKQRQPQRKKQIPRGNDRKKIKGNSKGGQLRTNN